MYKEKLEQVKVASFRNELEKLSSIKGSNALDIIHSVVRHIPVARNLLAKKLGLTDASLSTALKKRDPKEQDLQRTMSLISGNAAMSDRTISGYRILNAMYPKKG